MALVFAAMGVLIVATFLMQVTRVNGPRMQPTLQDNDCVLVDRLVYELGTPRPGDIVTLYDPVDPNRMFIKRVIATDEQSVQIIGGRVFVNGTPLRDHYVDAAFAATKRAVER